jgi:hypothetical protein
MWARYAASSGIGNGNYQLRELQTARTANCANYKLREDRNGASSETARAAKRREQRNSAKSLTARNH